MNELTHQNQGKVCRYCAHVGGMEHDRHRTCRKNAPRNGKWAQTTNSGYCGEWFPSDYWMENRKWFERGKDPIYKSRPMSPAVAFDALEEAENSKRKQEAVLRLVRLKTYRGVSFFILPVPRTLFIKSLIAMGWLHEDELINDDLVCLTCEGERRINKLTAERLGLG